MRAPDPLALGIALERRVIGQRDAIWALQLGLIAREHVYLEGPSGCAKSLLAESLCSLAGLDRALILLGRESRADDWLGDAVLHREPVASGAERISRRWSGGTLEAASAWILEDLGAAPADLAAPLLGALASRRLGGRALRLEIAIALACAPSISDRSALAAGELGAAALDGFALQVRMRGLVSSQRVVEARALLQRGHGSEREPSVLRAGERAALQRRAAELPVDAATRARLIRTLAALQRLCAGRSASEVLLSDRFAVAALRVMRAHAVLRGAERVETRDLRALRFMLARRVPEADLAQALEQIAEASEAGQGELVPAASEAGSPMGAAASEARPAAPHAAPIERPLVRTNGIQAGPPAEIDALLRALEGSLARGPAALREDPGGTPRRYGRLRGLHELHDADPAEAWLYASGGAIDEPRVLRRESRRGGAVALLRDVSASMEGRLGRWAGDVVRAIAGLARRHRLRLGYAEFNHEVSRFSESNRFFHRRYAALAELGARRRSEGRTNFEAPLRLALEEFQRLPGCDRHVVLLTDGLPVAGDPSVARERKLAQRLGVRVHTVFLGTGPVPDVLDRLSIETGGLRFRARPQAGGRLAVESREKDTACTAA